MIKNSQYVVSCKLALECRWGEVWGGLKLVYTTFNTKTAVRYRTVDFYLTDV